MEKIFPNTFSGKVGKLKDVQAHIPISSEAELKFHKARPVLYALRKRVEDELDALEVKKW